jgi:uncharacterized protein
MNIDVQHDPDGKKFYCVINGLECVMEYDLLDEKTMNVTHTYVPTELRNQGIAEAILTRAGEYAVREEMRIVPTCSYASYYFKKHKEFKMIVKD